MNENQVHEQILQGQVARPVRLDGPAPTPPEPAAIDVSVVTGTLNRLSVLKPCIESVRNNGFKGSLEIIAVDGGSKDGTADWLAQQKDIFTILQPNYKIPRPGKRPRLAHSWGEFMNIGFRRGRGKWIMMISDDVLLPHGCIQRSVDLLEGLLAAGKPVGAGALYYRDYPRAQKYHVKQLPQGVLNVNHGFYLKSALEAINYIDEHSYIFRAGDGDLCLRLAEAGYPTVALEGCFAEHLAHLPDFRRLFSTKVQRVATDDEDMMTFYGRWGAYSDEVREIYAASRPADDVYRNFWRTNPVQCVLNTLVMFAEARGYRRNQG